LVASAAAIRQNRLAALLVQPHIHAAIEIDLQIPPCPEPLAPTARAALLVIDHHGLPVGQPQQAIGLAMHGMAKNLAREPEFIAHDLGPQRGEHLRPVACRLDDLAFQRAPLDQPGRALQKGAMARMRSISRSGTSAAMAS
jgi:hypothetical protein